MQTYKTKVEWTGSNDRNKKPELVGPQFCFQGQHCLDPLPPEDTRTTNPFTRTIVASPTAQAEIDSLKPDVRLLNIVSSQNYDESIELDFAPATALPNLEEVQLTDVAFRKIRLTRATAPSIKKFTMQNVQGHCDLQLDLPELEECIVRFYDFRTGHGQPSGFDAAARPQAKVIEMLQAVDFLALPGFQRARGFGSAQERLSRHADPLGAQPSPFGPARLLQCQQRVSH